MANERETLLAETEAEIEAELEEAREALEEAREARFEAGQSATFIGADGSWNLRCVIVEKVEGWWKVRFSDHTEFNPSEAIVRPSSLTAAIAKIE